MCVCVEMAASDGEQGGVGWGAVVVCQCHNKRGAVITESQSTRFHIDDVPYTNNANKHKNENSTTN